MAFDNLNLGHPDPKIQHQAYGTLNALLTIPRMVFCVVTHWIKCRTWWPGGIRPKQQSI